MEENKYEEQQLFKTKPLKEIYPDLELRKKFFQQKMQGKGPNQVLVRCEPHPKHCNLPKAPFIILIAPSYY